MSREEMVNKLVNDLGFNRTEATMALEDTLGDVDRAIDRLLQGDYAPPPYTSTSTTSDAEGEHLTKHPHTNAQNEKSNCYSSKKQETNLYPSMKNFLNALPGRSRRPEVEQEDPTAPPLLVDLSDAGEQEPTPSSSSSNTVQQQFDTLPPPYQKFKKDNKMRDWEQEMQISYYNEQSGTGDFSGFSASRSERCPVCFNAAVSEAGGSHGIVCHKGQVFHHGCFMKKHGPQCAHCYFPLTQADKDHELSGQYLVYKNKDYHVECYEKYAGPRCSHCFNVIIERGSGEFSGQYVIDNHKEYHIECLQQKMYSTWRAKNI